MEETTHWLFGSFADFSSSDIILHRELDLIRRYLYVKKFGKLKKKNDLLWLLVDQIKHQNRTLELRSHLSLFDYVKG